MRQYSTLFNIIRRNSTFFDPQIMSKNVAVHNFCCQIMLRTSKKVAVHSRGTFDISEMQYIIVNIYKYRKFLSLIEFVPPMILEKILLPSPLFFLTPNLTIWFPSFIPKILKYSVHPKVGKLRLHVRLHVKAYWT